MLRAGFCVRIIGQHFCDAWSSVVHKRLVWCIRDPARYHRPEGVDDVAFFLT